MKKLFERHVKTVHWAFKTSRYQTVGKNNNGMASVKQKILAMILIKLTYFSYLSGTQVRWHHGQRDGQADRGEASHPDTL